MTIRIHARRALLVPALAGLLAAAACQWAPAPVPADPGLNARLRGRAEILTMAAPAQHAGAPQGDPQAADLYYRRCATCHDPFQPASFRAVEWPRYVRRYGARAGLFGSERRRVLAWLQANAAP